MADTIDRILVHEVAGWAESRLDRPFSLEGLSELPGDVLAMLTAIGIVGNGGFVYWYEGKGRDDTLRVASAFDRMGLHEAGDAMRESLSAFRDGTPHPSLSDRHGWMSEHRAELEARFHDLDRVIWKADWAATAARYVFRRRRELVALDPGFGPLLQQYEAADLARTTRLRSAAAALAPDARERCEGAISTGALTAALDAAISAGAGQREPFWIALAEVGRALGHEERAERCDWLGRIAARGALRVAIALVPAGEISDGETRVHRTGDAVRWNAGEEPAGTFRARRAKLFIPGRGWAEPGEACELLLVPGDAATATGAALVVHDGGEVLGRGRVVERLEPRSS